jgi:hypothetical protein
VSAGIKEVVMSRTLGSYAADLVLGALLAGVLVPIGMAAFPQMVQGTGVALAVLVGCVAVVMFARRERSSADRH